MLLPRIDSLLWPSNRRDSGAAVGMMKLNNILNTNNWPSEAPHSSRIMQTQYEVPHYPQAPHDMSAPQYSQNLYVPNNNRIKSENGSERGVSPHPSDPSSRYSSQAPPSLHHAGYAQAITSLPSGMRYPSPSQMHQPMPMIQHSYHPNPPTDPNSYVQQAMNAPPPVHDQQQQQDGLRTTGSGLPKAFACSTCSKGFARRSDLARHGTYSSASGP